MPLFHFNIANHHRELDDEGTELPNEDAARIEAVTFAGAYLRDQPELVWDGRIFRVEVTDDDGRFVFGVKIEATTVGWPVSDRVDGT